MHELNKDAVPGLIDFLILSTLALAPLNGSDIEHRVEQRARRFFRLNSVSFLAALRRLAGAGWIKSESQAGDPSDQVKFYSLTQAGKQRLQAEWKGAAAALEDLFAKRGPLSDFPQAHPPIWN